MMGAVCVCPDCGRHHEMRLPKQPSGELDRLRAENERLRQQLYDQRWQLPSDEMGILRARIAELESFIERARLADPSRARVAELEELLKQCQEGHV